MLKSVSICKSVYFLIYEYHEGAVWLNRALFLDFRIEVTVRVESGIAILLRSAVVDCCNLVVVKVRTKQKLSNHPYNLNY